MTATVMQTQSRLSHRVVLLTMCLGVLVAQIDTSVVTLAIKQIGADLGAGIKELQWVVDAYNVVYASVLLTGGTLGDLYGRRRIFVWGIALFAVGSLLCAGAPNAGTLIVGRALTGLGAALEFPASLAILSAVYLDGQERTRAIGIWASCNGLAFAIGPTIGGVLVEAVGWRSIFLVVIPFGILALLLALKAVPESSRPQERRLEPLSQVLATSALAALSLTVIEGPHWGWTSVATLACGGFSVAATLLFIGAEARTRGALIPFVLVHNSVFVASLGVAACMTFGMYGLLFLAPLYLQSVTGAPASLAGVELLPLSLTFFVMSQYSGRIANAYGPRLPMAWGMLLMGVGEIMFGWAAAGANMAIITAALMIVGCGLGLNTGPVNAVAIANAPAARSGTASGLVNTARMVGATFGVAALGAVFAIYSGGNRGPDEFVTGLQPALAAGGTVELIGAFAVLALIRRGSLEPIRA